MAGTAAIESLSLTQLRLPLTVPYKLAFGDVTHFDTVLVELHLDDGRHGLGEATILTGYTNETVPEAWRAGCDIARRCVNLSASEARTVFAASAQSVPFTVAAFGTALEMAEGRALLASDAPRRVPLLFGLNPVDPGAIDAALDEAFAAGFETVKVKVGFDLEKDQARMRHIQAANAGRMSLRVDGNQGYDTADAVRFAGELDPSDVELLEQPCHMDNWAGHEEVARVSTVPLMLDESIYTPADIDRAADLGAGFVKLKLMKSGSLDALAAGLERIRRRGMKPVLGNGVASDIGCWMEACVAAAHIDNAGEMNGFLRQDRPLVTNPLAFSRGAVEIPPAYRPRLDSRRMTDFTVAARRFGATTKTEH